MSYTDLINKRFNISDIYIAVRIHDSQTMKSELVTNVPDEFREIYYRNRYNEMDDTFEYTEKHPLQLCFPNTQNSTHQSDFLPILESHGFFNLASFCIGEHPRLTCVITLPQRVEDAKSKFLSMREDIVQWCQEIVDEYCQLANSDDFDFTEVPKY